MRIITLNKTVKICLYFKKIVIYIQDRKKYLKYIIITTNKKIKYYIRIMNIL